MARTSPYPAEMRARAVRIAGEVGPNYDGEFAAIKALKRDIAKLRRANEILNAASASFAPELDRPPGRS